jgi:phytoene/squalene synthetase
MRIEVGRARELYRDAAEGLCWVAGDGSCLAAATLLTWQAALLDRIAGDCDGVFSRRPALTKGDKLRRLPLAWRLARRRSGRRLPDLFPASCPRPSGRAR